MPLDYLLRNRNILTSYPHNKGDKDIGEWEFWRFQKTIEDINKQKEEKENKDSISALSTMKKYNNG